MGAIWKWWLAVFKAREMPILELIIVIGIRFWFAVDDCDTADFVFRSSHSNDPHTQPCSPHYFDCAEGCANNLTLRCADNKVFAIPHLDANRLLRTLLKPNNLDSSLVFATQHVRENSLLQYFWAAHWFVTVLAEPAKIFFWCARKSHNFSIFSNKWCQVGHPCKKSLVHVFEREHILNLLVFDDTTTQWV